MASSERDLTKNQLRVGRLLKAHGLKGGLKVELYTDAPERRFVPGAEFTLQVPVASAWHGKTIAVRDYRVMNQNPVVFFDDVFDRDAAESLVKAILWMDEDDAHEEDAWYDHQLVGLRVVRDGTTIGRISRVEHPPAQDLLIVDTGGSEVMLPLVSVFVPNVDILGGTVTITPPAGLFEDIPVPDDADTGLPAQDGARTPTAAADDA